MLKATKVKLVVWAIGVGFVFLMLMSLATLSIELYSSEQVAVNYAEYAASLQAHADFEKNRRRLYEVVPGGRKQFLGKQKAGYEVWGWPCDANERWWLVNVDRKAAESFVQVYNNKMKDMRRD
jgi:hypothetical protein